MHEYFQGKFNNLETNSNNKNIRDLYGGINGFKKGLQPSTNLVKQGTGDLLDYYQNILNRWENHMSWLTLDGLKFIQLSHKCSNLQRLWLSWLFEVDVLFQCSVIL
jgi:hypothetical protein